MQAALTAFPFAFGALQFAAIELTKGILLGNLADNLTRNPIPDVLKKIHGITVTILSFTRTLTNFSGSAAPEHYSDVNAHPACSLGMPATARDLMAQMDWRSLHSSGAPLMVIGNQSSTHEGHLASAMGHFNFLRDSENEKVFKKTNHLPLAREVVLFCFVLPCGHTTTSIAQQVIFFHRTE